ncbi:MAG: hypothetical protein Q8L94_17290 [Parvibaculum sp.]|uniref:hypothetical protein n=1 Tax=Parvibaculum sp. TaxID=2024848 RepID=UPI0027315B2F|nr:hypothetical protein [Parvibaculum sp.]MDP1628874.1 hypothetical protein [Parvibaculum sp.]MDP2148269.1 hypothetical protein [Parvibaculum sp.]
MTVDESLMRKCDRGTDLEKLPAGTAAVPLIDSKDALLGLCADRQEALAHAVRFLTGEKRHDGKGT